MNLNQNNINEFLNKYISFVDEVSEIYKYNSNIKHLLYLIVPAFVYKYGIENEGVIFQCFREVEIYTSEKKDNYVYATFNRLLKKGKTSYYTEKFIVLNDYSSTGLPTLIDNIVHEFNHAINSINNEVTYDNKYIYVRTGVSRLIYDKNNLRFIRKTDEVALEEIINTNDTEEVINIINDFSKYNIDNVEISNLIYAMNGETNGVDYVSSAYSYQKSICKSLLNNKTFLPTIKNLRIKGYVEDIPNLFDTVIGTKGSYDKLNKTLSEMHLLIIKYSNSKLLKKHYLNKIRDKTDIVSNLINDYEKKCIFR